MAWSRLGSLVIFTGGLWIVACIAVPGTDVVSLAQMAAFVIVLPWLITFVAYGPCALLVATADRGHRASNRVHVSANVLRTLGGLTWAAGIMGAYGTTLQLLVSFPEDGLPDNLGLYDVPLRAISAMLVPPAFALIVRLTLYDPLARALEGRDASAGPATETTESIRP